MSGGRPQDRTRCEIKTWTEDYTAEDGESKQRTVWSCNHCGFQKVFSSIGRCALHLTGDHILCKGNGGVGACPNVPASVKAHFLAAATKNASKKRLSAETATARSAAEARAAGAHGDAPAVKKSRILGPLDKAFGKGTSKAADDAIADFLYSCNTVAPAILGTPAFRKMIKCVKNTPSSWVPPTRQRVLGPLLDARHGYLLIERDHAYDKDPFGKSVSTDGATVNGQSLVNVVVGCATRSQPLSLGIVNAAVRLLQEGSKGGMFYAETVAACVRRLPDLGYSVMLVITDTPTEMQLAWKILRELLPWIFVQPCVSHCGNSILKKMCGLSIVADVFKWASEVNDMFVGPHLPRALLRKHTTLHLGHALGCLRPCESRYCLNVLLFCRLLRLHNSLLAVVADPLWIENLDTPRQIHPVKALILDLPRWDFMKRVLTLVFPAAMIVKFGDFHQPALPWLWDKLDSCEALWHTAAAPPPDDDDDDPEGVEDARAARAADDLRSVAGDLLKIIGDDDLEQVDADNQSIMINRWRAMKTPVAAAAYAMNPEFHWKKPWSAPAVAVGLRAAVDQILSFDKATGKIDETRLMELRRAYDREWATYTNRCGIFSKDYVWDVVETTPPYIWWDQNGDEVPLLKMVAMKLTSLNCGSGDAERDWKRYKLGVSKFRTCLGASDPTIYARLGESQTEIKEADLLALSRPTPDSSLTQTTGTKLATVNALLHCESYNECGLDDATAELRSFDAVDIAAMRNIFAGLEGTAAGVCMGQKFPNFLEPFEKNTSRKGDEIFVAKLRDKYLGMRLHDVETGPDGYDEKRVIHDISWRSSRPKGYFVLTGLLGDGGLVDNSQDARQNYFINDALHQKITPAMNPNFTFTSS